MHIIRGNNSKPFSSKHTTCFSAEKKMDLHSLARCSKRVVVTMNPWRCEGQNAPSHTSLPFSRLFCTSRVLCAAYQMPGCSVLTTPFDKMLQCTQSTCVGPLQPQMVLVSAFQCSLQGNVNSIFLHLVTFSLQTWFCPFSIQEFAFL
jgi:hypothetical protein